jgi:hypothetical protein
MLTLPDSDFVTQDAPPVQPMTLESPCVPALPDEVVSPFIPALRPASPTSRREAAVALITCVLVVIVGSLPYLRNS